MRGKIIVILITFIFYTNCLSIDTSCTSCPEGDGWVGPIRTIDNNGVDCLGRDCILFFKYCYRIVDNDGGPYDIDIFICSWGPEGIIDPANGMFPCSFRQQLPCDTENAMEIVKKYLVRAIAQDLAEKDLVTDCQYDDEFLIRYNFATCYQTIFENNIQDQMVYIKENIRCEGSGTCKETYRFCIDLNKPSGPPVIVFQALINSDSNQQIQCTSDYLFIPSFNPYGPQIIYGPCFGFCKDVSN